jgi:glycosyltransferase 2 family protein
MRAMLSQIGSLRRPAAPFAIALVSISIIALNADLNSIQALFSAARLWALPAAAAVMCLIVLAFSWRWETLLRGAICKKSSTVITAIGLAGNQLLPLRGGDALRIALSSRSMQIHGPASAMALEKILDLLAVAGLGLIALRLSVTGANAGLATGVGILTLGTISSAGLIVLAAWSRRFQRLIALGARTLHAPRVAYRHWVRTRIILSKALVRGRLALLLPQTLLIWFGLYALVYQVIGFIVGVPLSLTDTVIVLFAGAIGLAIPGAPSGLGTFHAAIGSAFLILGRSFDEGLVLALAAHAVFFLSLCGCGLIAATFASRTPGKLLPMSRPSTN